VKRNSFGRIYGAYNKSERRKTRWE